MIFGRKIHYVVKRLKNNVKKKKINFKKLCKKKKINFKNLL